MSAVPDDKPQRRTSTTSTSDLMVTALLDESRAQVAATDSEERIRIALNAHAESLHFAWQTSDDREVDLRVYYRNDAEPEILASELVRIDYRRPTTQERMRVEAEFNVEIDAAADIWQRLSSEIQRPGV